MTPEEPRQQEEQRTGIAQTANDEFKENYGRWFAGGLIFAVLAHFALFELFPQFRAADIGTKSKAMEQVELPPQVEIPPPPKQIARPATPKVSSAEISEDVTISETTFESNPVEKLPPPPSGEGKSDRPSFIPYDVAPELKNASEVQQYLQRVYPPSLKQSGIGGTVVLWIFVDKQGQVQKARVQKSSGYDALDQAAKKVADQMVFSPAMNRDKKTAVWVQQRVQFQVK
ncbi:MAG: energy transducer TonB [Gemmatimonadota bacterium]